MNESNLRPWKPGQSGNPDGVPKRSLKLRKLLLKHGEKAIATVLDVMANAVEPRDRLAAAKCILDFIPKQPEKREHVVRAVGRLKPELAAKLAAMQ